MEILRIGTDFSDEAAYSFVMDNFSGRMTAETVGVLQYTRRRALERIGKTRNMLENKATSEKRTVNENSTSAPPLKTPTKPNKIMAFGVAHHPTPFLFLSLKNPCINASIVYQSCTYPAACHTLPHCRQIQQRHHYADIDVSRLNHAVRFATRRALRRLQQEEYRSAARRTVSSENVAELLPALRHHRHGQRKQR